jgi:hypothetical protein
VLSKSTDALEITVSAAILSYIGSMLSNKSTDALEISVF